MPAVFLPKSEAECDPPNPPGECPFPAEVPLLLDGPNERFLNDVVGGLLIPGNGRERVPKPEVLLAIQILEFCERGVHIP